VHTDRADDAALIRHAGITGETGRKYRPNRLLDELVLHFELECDAELARMLGVHRSVISKIRTQGKPVSADLLLCIHDLTSISIRELRNIMGDTKEKYFSIRRSSSQYKLKKRKKRPADS